MKSREWKKTSATQHQAFQDCERYWFYGWIMGLERGGSDALNLGIKVHNEAEHYLKTGIIRDTNERLYIEALKEILPPPQSPDLIVEKAFNMSCGPGLPKWVGKIDVGYSAGPILQLHDIKTTSDFRWSKTRAELEDNIQMMSYARVAYEEFGYDGDIEVAHLYVKTSKGVKPRKKPQTKIVDTVVDKLHVLGVWDREMGTVRRMQSVALAEKETDVDPTGVSTGYCTKFGGCPFAERCPRPAMTVGAMFRGRMNENEREQHDEQKEGSAVNILERLKKQKKEAEEGADGVPTGILPPDAPSRVTPVKEPGPEPSDDTGAEEIAAEKPKKRGRPKKKKGADASTEAETSGLCLYIGCMPLKNGDDEPTLMEDWLGPIIMDLNEKVMKKAGVSDYRLLEFHQPKVAFTEAVTERLGSLPSSMVVTTMSDSARMALEIIKPHATQVVCAVRD